MKMGAEGQIARDGVERGPAVQGPPSEGHTKQYSLAKILGIWALATLPMGVLGWVVFPLIAPDSGPTPSGRASQGWCCSRWV
jgi:hypothetical protein